MSYTVSDSRGVWGSGHDSYSAQMSYQSARRGYDAIQQSHATLATAQAQAQGFRDLQSSTYSSPYDADTYAAIQHCKALDRRKAEVEPLIKAKCKSILQQLGEAQRAAGCACFLQDFKNRLKLGKQLMLVVWREYLMSLPEGARDEFPVTITQGTGYFNEFIRRCRPTYKNGENALAPLSYDTPGVDDRPVPRNVWQRQLDGRFARAYPAFPVLPIEGVEDATSATLRAIYCIK